MLGHYKTIKAMEEVVANPRKSFSVRGLASAAGISVGSAKIALEFMESKGIVKFNAVGKTHQYRANIESALCRQWKILFNLDGIEESGFVEKLLGQLEGVQSVLLYGSLGKGTNDEKSDADILVITNKPQKKRVSVSSRLGREVNITAMGFSEWKKKALQDKVFYENIIFDSIVLYGNRPVVL